MNRRSFIKTLPALAALATVPALGLARAGTARTGVVTASALNVRSGPGVYHHAVGVVHGGERVGIHDYANGWYEISTRRINGWVSGSYIQTSDYYDDDRRPYDDYREYHHDNDGYAKPPPRRGRGRFAVIGRNRWGYINMFDGPGRRYPVIARLSEGERVRIIDEGPRWTLVGKRGVGRGYVRSRFLEYYR
jgi:uncharacterized protein YraI